MQAQSPKPLQLHSRARSAQPHQRPPCPAKSDPWRASLAPLTARCQVHGNAEVGGRKEDFMNAHNHGVVEGALVDDL